MKTPLSSIYWLWIPVFVMCLQIGLEIFVSGPTLSLMLSENGPHEILQVIIMACCFFVAFYCFFNSQISKTHLLRFWFFMAAICSLYVATEEVSYGQHIWNWATPEFWASVNDQEETNLHNTSSWFDQKPRFLLMFGIVVGTLIFPILKRYNLFLLPPALDFLLPSPRLSIVALIVIVPHLIEKIFEAFDIVLFARFSEVQELYIFYFVFLYLIMLKQKIVTTVPSLEKT